MNAASGAGDTAIAAAEVLARWPVGGMHCASCAARIEATLGEADGVGEASVNYATHEARVLFDARETSPEKLAQLVARTGYTLEINADDDPHLGERYDDEARGIRRLGIGAALLTAPVLVLAMGGFDSPGSRWLQALLTAPVVFGFGATFHRGAWRQLRHGAANMDSLISLGTLAAFGHSLAGIWFDAPVYFETAAVIITLILLGRFFETRAKGRASRTVEKLLSLGAKDVALLRDGREVLTPIEALRLGDLFAIRPGERVATDAEVVEGRSSFDESSFTGESVPVDRGPGDALFGASLNLQGRVVARATRVGRETALARIVELVRETQASKAPIQKLADRVAGVFVPTVIGIAALTLAGWFIAGAPLQSALANAVAVLVIACPCALGLATPTAILVGGGRGAELGVLFKGAEIFERSRDIDAVAFDKTGTLTTGEMTLARVVSLGDENELLRWAGSIEAGSTHPIAIAVADGARARGLELEAVEDFENQPGRGVRGRLGDTEVWVGTLRWARELGATIPEIVETALTEMEARGWTAFAVWSSGAVAGAVGVSDTLRPESAATVASLGEMGIRVAMITGDNRRTAKAVAETLGIDDVRAEVMPDAKADAIRDLQAADRRVAFVGDGINDAPALTQADLGIAIGTGADIAIEAGGVVIPSGDLHLAVVALQLARRTYRTIRQNLFWAFAYNAAAIPLAAAGLLDPMLAAGAMAFSSVSVVGNSLRLRSFGGTPPPD